MDLGRVSNGERVAGVSAILLGDAGAGRLVARLTRLGSAD